MSEATDALTEGLADAITQHGQTFTVDGEEGSFTGVVPPQSEQYGYNLGGDDTEGKVTFVIARATWTPFRNAIVTYQGNRYTVEAIHGQVPTQWEFTAVLRNT